MPSRTLAPVSGSAETTGSALIVVEDLKNWTARIVTNDPSSNTFNYSVQIVGSAAEAGNTGYLLKSGSSVGDVLINNNDGSGCPVSAYAVYIAWNTLSGGTVSVLMRQEY